MISLSSPTIRTLTTLLTLLPTPLHGACYDPSPAFQLPKHVTYTTSPKLTLAFAEITSSLQHLLSPSRPDSDANEFSTSSLSIEVTTSTASLWELHHTAETKNESRPGAETVDGGSVYRVASITKAFTVLGVIEQHVKGRVDIDGAIDEYLAGLEGVIPWKDITLRTVGSQLSGLPRDFAQADLFNSVEDPLKLGLPPNDGKGMLKCDESSGKPCTAKDLLESLSKSKPLWPPKQKSTYSNINFDLLGLVLENVTGMDYSDYIEKTILKPLNMTSSSFTKPNDSVAVLPKGKNYWDFEEGVQKPTGGLYSSSNDMSKFLRHVLSSYNGLSPQFNWFSPVSYSDALSSFYGMPWEIYRTRDILPVTSRPVTFVTKGGGLPGYFTYIIMAPDYDLGITIFTAGESNELLDLVREIVTVPLLRAAESIAQSDLLARYTGTFKAGGGLNSTLVLRQSDSKSLFIESFVSNGTDIFEAWKSFIDPLSRHQPYRLQLVPTLLYRDEEGKKGELWRGTVVPENSRRRPWVVWDDMCTTDLDPMYYAGEPLLEVVFWGGEDGRGVVEVVELSAFRVRLRRDEGESGGRGRLGDLDDQMVVPEKVRLEL